MDTNKLSKISGSILYIKAFVQLITGILGLFGGIYMTIEGNRLTNLPPSQTGDPSTDISINCSQGLTGAIYSIFGVVFIIVSIILLMLFLVYFFNARKILRGNNKLKEAIITMIVFEIIYSISSFSILYMQISMIDEIIITFILTLLVTIQSIITVILLFKLLSKVKVG